MPRSRGLVVAAATVLLVAAASAGSPTDGRDDYPVGVVTHSSGIYVVGWSTDPTTGIDFQTLKYDASGTLLWSTAFPDTSVTYRTDSATAVAVDTWGNAYVVGNCWDSAHSESWVAVVKYNPDGEKLAEAKYDSSGLDECVYAAAVDRWGNLCAAGASRGSSGAVFLTLAYDTACNFRWAGYHRRAFDDSAVARDIAVDGVGLVYVAGESFRLDRSYTCVTLQYSGSTVRCSLFYTHTGEHTAGLAIAVADTDKFYVVGPCRHDTAPDYLTIYCELPNPSPQAIRVYSGSGLRWDRATDVAIDDSGYVYVAGLSANPGGRYDIVTLKYRGGTLDSLWCQRAVANDTNRFGIVRLAPGRGGDRATGHIHVGGTAMQAGQGNDFAVVTYRTSDAGLTWSTPYDGPDHGDDRLTGIAVDEAGDVYVVGASDAPGSGSDFVTMKLDGDSGDSVWAERWDREDDGIDEDKTAAAIPRVHVNSLITAGRPATVRYSLPGVARGVIELWNTAGMRVLTKELPRRSKGAVAIEASKLGAGVYFLHLRASDLLVRRKVIMQR
jgi:hypothetical protein